MTFLSTLLSNWLSVAIVFSCGAATLPTLTTKTHLHVTNRVVPFLCFVATLAVVLMAANTSAYGVTTTTVITVLGVSTFQYAAFILSSRAKERSSNIAVTLTGLLSHSSYYILFGVLADFFNATTQVTALSLLFVPYFSGMMIGRLAFKRLARTYDVAHTADATLKHPKETLWWFGQTLPSETVLTRVLHVFVVIGLVLSFVWWEQSWTLWFTTSAVLLFFPILMAIGGTIVPRLLNRDKVGPATIAALSSGFAFPFLSAYLIGTKFPLAFLFMYTVVSTLGSVWGKLASERLERWLNIRPDRGVNAKNRVVIRGLTHAMVLVFVGVTVLYTLGVVAGLPANDRTPLWLVNTPFLLVVGLFCAFIIAQSFTHGISSRFGKRNEPGGADTLHARSLVAHGLVMYPYTVLQLGVLNDLRSIPIFLTLMVLSGALGALLAKEFGERVEATFGLSMA